MRRRGEGLLPKYHWCTMCVMFMAWKSKECPGLLARKCSVPGTFFTSTKPAAQIDLTWYKREGTAILAMWVPSRYVRLH